MIGLKFLNIWSYKSEIYQDIVKTREVVVSDTVTMCIAISVARNIKK